MGQFERVDHAGAAEAALRCTCADFLDREEVEFTETALRTINSYDDIESGLDDALDRVINNWQDNERRSDRGY